MRRAAPLGSLWQRRRRGSGLRLAPGQGRLSGRGYHILSGMSGRLPPPLAAPPGPLPPHPDCGSAPGDHAPDRLLLPACRGQRQLRGGDACEAPAGRQAGRRELARQGRGQAGFAEGAVQGLSPACVKGTHCTSDGTSSGKSSQTVKIRTAPSCHMLPELPGILFVVVVGFLNLHTLPPTSL